MDVAKWLAGPRGTFVRCVSPPVPAQPPRQGNAQERENDQRVRKLVTALFIGR